MVSDDNHTDLMFDLAICVLTTNLIISTIVPQVIRMKDPVSIVISLNMAIIYGLSNEGVRCL